ncbi:hypothetical protein KFK09_014012 [Dendrobium nobile]|uniref:Transcriptional corepressor SEUSS n=1 Tax=Dendrobium nobile TaxID=94219 RepID=A0A8T3BAI4_DENNO|nr:hypothetical protein KFK09_014012 [Dendrobium nobile]
MIPSGSPTPIGGAQSVGPSLMRTNSSILGGVHNNSIPSQTSFSSLGMPRAQFNSNDLLSNISNVSSFLNHSFGNELVASGGGLDMPPLNIKQQGSTGAGVTETMGHTETNTMPFTASSGSIYGQQFQKPSTNQHGLDHPQSQQRDGLQKFQQQFSLARSQQQQLLEGLTNMNNMPSVKLEPQMVSGDQNGSVQQLQALRNMGTVRMEQQQLQSLRSLAPIKTEHQLSDPSVLLQQQPQLLQLSRQSSQAAAHMSILQQQQQQQQRLLQLQQQQQQQQQQIVNNLPRQRSHLQQQLHQQSLSARAQVKPTGYEPGVCARRLTHYMYHQQHRPEDNNIEFWRKFIYEYFAPNAKKRWCVSLYGSVRQTTGVFPQDAWHCEICSCKPGRGFETTVEVLPRLCQIKYASGTLEELLYVDMPHEYLNASGQIVLDYAKAIQESVFEQLRVVRDGQLRIVFNQDLKIASWEFCARRHEELIPRRTIIQQVSQLGAVVHKYQAAAQNASNLSAQDLQIACNSFVASARQLAKALEVPLVNDLGYTKRYVRCLQISEVVNSMKDLIDYSRETDTGPMDSLINFPKGANASTVPNYHQTQQLKEQQCMAQNLNQSNQNLSHPKGMQISSCNGGVGVNNSIGAATSISASTPGISSILLQNSISSRQETPMSTVSSPYGVGNTVQIPSASSSDSATPSSLLSMAPSSSNKNPIPTSHFSSRNSFSSLSTTEQPCKQTHEADPNDSQSSVQQILHEMLMSPHANGVSTTVNELKGIGGIARVGLTGGNCMVGNGIVSGAMDFGGMSGGITPTSTDAGIRAAINNNAMSMNGRIGINHLSQNLVGMNHQQQQDLGSRLLGSLGAVNGFNSLQFD